jgi:molybdopterin converting factor small subunit
MGIKIEIPLILQQFTNSRESVEVKGNNVRECMDDLVKQYPNFKEWFDENNPIAWIVLNQEMVSLADRDKQVTESDRLGLILLLVGG